MGNKGKAKSNKQASDGDDLRMSGQQVAIEQAVEIQRRLAEQAAEETPTGAVEAAPDRPCTIYALGAGCSGGFLGGLYGFGSKLVMHRGGGRLKAAGAESMSSAKAFATFGGVYALSSCIIQRLMQREDAVTSGVAGLTTGFVMGIGGGLQSALASAAMMGAFSLVLESFGKPAAQAQHLQAEQQLEQLKDKRPRARASWKPAAPSPKDLIAELLCPALPIPGMSCGRKRRQPPCISF